MARKPKAPADDSKNDARAGESLGDVISKLAREVLAETRKPYAPAERRRLLENIADRSLEWWNALIVTGHSKGTGAARDSYREAITEIERIDQRLSGFGARIDVRVNGIRLGDLDFGADSREGTDHGEMEGSPEGLES